MVPGNSNVTFFIYFQDLVCWDWEKKIFFSGYTNRFLQRTSPSSHAWDDGEV
jgi:hypothetical protein